jgi:hypothetical protein
MDSEYEMIVNYLTVTTERKRKLDPSVTH